MTHARRNAYRVMRLGGIAGVLAGALMAAQAVAGESSGQQDSSVVAQRAASLAARLGESRAAGSWVASDGQAVVAVTDAAAAQQVRQAGVRAKVVRYNMRQLDAAVDTLRAAPTVTGTAWSVDPASNKVVVLADSTVSASEWSSMKGVAQRIGGEVTMQRTTSSFTTRTAGADPIFTQQARCSVGFNVTNGTTGFILTAGHCGPKGTNWFQDERGRTQVGATLTSDFPGHDWSLVSYQNTSLSQDDVVDVGNGQQVKITGSADAVVGQQVFRSGSTTGLHTGTVTALGATVNYPEGTVTGLIQTNVCAEAGDSGGPLFTQGTALGITSGGSGDCTSGGVTFFQPVNAALTALGVRLNGTAASSASAGTAPSAAAASSPPSAAAAAPAVPGSPSDQAGFSFTVAGTVITLKALTPGLITAGASLLIILTARWVRPAGSVTRRRRGDPRDGLERWDPNGPLPLPEANTPRY